MGAAVVFPAEADHEVDGVVFPFGGARGEIVFIRMWVGCWRGAFEFTVDEEGQTVGGDDGHDLAEMRFGDVGKFVDTRMGEEGFEAEDAAVDERFDVILVARHYPT